MPDVLSAQGFGRRYRRRSPWAVRDVSFSLPKGSITALVGPNGAGKSTLIRSCIGFERPDEGRILVLGTDPAVDRAQAVNNVGYVSQGAYLYRTLSIADHFVMAVNARPSFDRQYALSRITKAGLSPDRRISELSGGEQAQVALALALGTRAPLLLLDEPLASLDPLARRDFLTALTADIRERKATALLSSHIVTDVEQACDRLLVLAAGRVVLDSEVTAARARFRIGFAETPEHGTVVASFLSAEGKELVLYSGGDGGQPASLEEIVLGHLAAGRGRRTEVN